ARVVLGGAMTKTISSVLAIAAVALGVAVLAGSRGGFADDAPTAPIPRHDSPASASGNLVVELCDGKTAAEIPGVREGETPTREQAEAVVGQLMAEWKAQHPDEEWEMPVRVAQAGSPGAPSAAQPAPAPVAAQPAPSGAPGVVPKAGG